MASNCSSGQCLPVEGYILEASSIVSLDSICCPWRQQSARFYLGRGHERVFCSQRLAYTWNQRLVKSACRPLVSQAGKQRGRDDKQKLRPLQQKFKGLRKWLARPDGPIACVPVRGYQICNLICSKLNAVFSSVWWSPLLGVLRTKYQSPFCASFLLTDAGPSTRKGGKFVAI
jgi:hypothetical protein